MNSDNTQLSKFAHKFDMEVRTGMRTRRRIKPQPLPSFQSMSDCSISHQMYAHDVPCYEITIPEDSFEYMVNAFTGLEHTVNNDQLARDILKSLRADERVRQDNPAVQQAYMKYIMLLEIARK
jgi:hypothetical protein